MRGQFVAEIWNRVDGAVIGINAEGLITHWNTGAESLTHYLAAEVMGKPLWHAQPEAAQPWVRALFEQLHERRYFHGQGWLLRKNGERCGVSVHVETQTDEQGHPNGWIGLLRDITHAIWHQGTPAAETTDAEWKGRLKQLQSHQTAAILCKGFTHQTSNLLTGVLSHLELALLEDNMPEGLRYHLLQAEQSARQAADSNARFSSFLRCPECLPTPVDLRRLAEETIVLLRRCVERRNHFTLEPTSPDLWMAQARENQIAEALVNLSLVAQMHMPAGGPIQIRLSNRNTPAATTAAQPHFVELCVSHTGLALEPAVQAGLLALSKGDFPQHPGALTLCLVKQIAEEHGGWLEVEAVAGGGNRFALVLPRAAAAANHPQSLAPQPSATEARQLEGTEKVLVADDEDMMRGLISAVLGYRGYQIIEASDGQAALQKYDPEFDLALVDVDMPGLDGWGVLRQIRSRHPAAKVVIMSGGGMDQTDLEKLHEFGAAGLLQKPFRNLELLQIVRRVLDRVEASSSLELLGGG